MVGNFSLMFPCPTRADAESFVTGFARSRYPGTFGVERDCNGVYVEVDAPIEWFAIIVMALALGPQKGRQHVS
jgi:hypothetical protein